MALKLRCEKHNVGYTITDIYSEWRILPMCPYCRKEWMEEHKSSWNFPVDYEVMYTNTLVEMEKCAVYITMDTASGEGMSSCPDPLLVGLYPWWFRVKHLARDAFWRIWFGLRIFLQGGSD